MNKYKNTGFLILELFLSFMLASIFLVTVYQTYQAVAKVVKYIGINNHFEIQKILFHYHITLDSMQIIFPRNLRETYTKIKNYDKATDKDKKKIDKMWANLSFFCPTIIKSEEKIIISWITKRRLLHKEGSYTKVAYIIQKEKAKYEDKNLYSLKRQEIYYNTDQKVIKEGNTYNIVSYIYNPIIGAIFAKLNEAEDQNIEIKNNKELIEKNQNAESKNTKEKNLDLYINWITTKEFITQNECNPPEMKNATKQNLIPHNISIEGLILSEDLQKESDIYISFDFPIADIIFEEICHPKEERALFNNQQPSDKSNNPNENKLKSNNITEKKEDMP